MKTFIASLLLISAVLTFVICNSCYIGGKIDELLEIAETLPADADAFEAGKDTLEEDMERLWQMWDESFNRIAFTAGYDNINRADDAILLMYISYRDGDGDDFAVARMTFCDGLKRLKMLESFTLDGIF